MDMPSALLHGSLSHLPPWNAWHVATSTVVGVGILSGLYLWGLHRTTPPGAPFPRLRVTSFFAGCAVLLLSLNGPIHELSDYYLLSAHMVQHWLLTLVVPLLWLLSIPSNLLDPLLDRPVVLRVARFLTKPVVAFLLYNGFLILWHFPRAYDWTLWSHEVHIAQHVGFLATGILMWWPVASPTTRLPRLPYGLAMLYLFLLTLPMKAIGAFVTLADYVLYDFYASAPRVLGLSSQVDQTIGGLLMWMPGGLIYWTTIAIIFYRWYDREEGLFGPTPATVTLETT